MKLKELPNTVVHCKTREEYDRLMKICEDAGCVWTFGDEKPTEWDAWSHCDHQIGDYIIVEEYLSRMSDNYARKNSGKKILSLSDFLREQGIAGSDEMSAIQQFKVFTLDGVPVQLWERDGTVQLRKSGRKGKSFAVTGDLDQWVSAFFDGYLSAPTK